MARRTIAAVLGMVALLLSQAAWAQRVVVLQFDGDRRDRVRTQIVRELNDSDVEIVPIRDFSRAAAREGLKGQKAMGPAGVAAVGKQLGLAVALDGRVSRTAFDVRILDATGAELWSKKLPVRRGSISSKNANRLARALVAAAKATQTAAPPPEPKAEVEQPPPPPTEVTVPPEATAPSEASNVVPEGELASPKQLEAQRVRARDEDQESHTLTGSEAAREELREEEFESAGARRRRHVGPKLIQITLSGTTTWRAYCSRPGVGSCAEYDAIPEADRPAGGPVDFVPQVPYMGFGLAAEFFPLGSLDNPANGIGLSGAFYRGFSRTNVTVHRDTGDEPAQEVFASDDQWHLFAHYRFYFGYGPLRDPLVGYVGVRGGVQSRVFEVDQTARVPLPGTHRRYPTVGLEASIPIVKLLRIEAGGLYFIAPTAGPDELVGYGQSVTSNGWQADGGIAGDVWGPLGYRIRVQYERYTDHFSGKGNLWPNGGVAEETYTTIFWGLTASF